MKVYTFWEPREKIPYYIQLCMKTWEKFLPNADIVLLDYKNLGEYIDMDELGENLFSGRFSLPKISDAIRVALLAKHGGVWMDADTIILRSDVEKYFLPDEKNRTVFFGVPETRGVHIAFINTPPGAECMNAWLGYIKEKLHNLTPNARIPWYFFGNGFIDSFVKAHVIEINVLDRNFIMPELKIVSKSVSRPQSYLIYYFQQNLHMADIDCDMLLLHNSWTPREYKNFSPEKFLHCDCTMTNVLAEALGMPLPPPTQRFRLCVENKRWVEVPDDALPKE